MTAIREHTEMQQVAARVSKETGTLVKLPSYKQVRTAVQHLKMDPDLVAMREGARISSTAPRVSRVLCALHSGSCSAHPGR